MLHLLHGVILEPVSCVTSPPVVEPASRGSSPVVVESVSCMFSVSGEAGPCS